MKKSIYTAIFCLFLGASASAQFGLGAGLLYGSESELGLTLRAHYDINEQLSAYAGYSVLQSETLEIFGVEIETLLTSIDLDGHYHFGGEKINPYVLAGLNVLRASVSATGVDTESETSMGVNLGGGALYGISDKFNVFGEAKYALNGGGEGEGDANQFVITGGVQYTF